MSRHFSIFLIIKRQGFIIFTLFSVKMQEVRIYLGVKNWLTEISIRNFKEYQPKNPIKFISHFRRGNFPWKRGGCSCLKNWSQKTETRGSKFAEDCAKYGGDEERGVATSKRFASGENKSEISAIRARKSFEHVSEITKSYKAIRVFFSW